MTMTLNDYMKDVTRLINDPNQEMINPQDTQEWINRARRQVAMQAQCIRLVSPISGQVSTISITDAGSGYTGTPTITLSAPDFPSGQGTYPTGSQATAVATVASGTISNIAVTYGGDGYFQPEVTISGGGGTGGAATAATTPLTTTNQGQEVYPFSAVPLNTFPGVQEILSVRSVSFIYANYRYSLPCYSFSTYQARIRQYPLQYQYVPTMCAQLGQGANGSLYFYPLPSQAYQFELDCICLPINLEGNGGYEAIPDPWTDAVVWLATSYVYASLQNLNYSNYYNSKYTEYLKIHSASARPGRRVNPYAGW